MSNFTFFCRKFDFYLCLLVLEISFVSSRFNSTFKNDKCLKPLDYSVYPRCLIRSMVYPRIRCDTENTDEVTLIDTQVSAVTGIIFECFADEPLDMEFDGLMPLPQSVVVPTMRYFSSKSKPEYSLLFGYKPVDRQIVGKYSFFKVGNRSLEKSFYVYLHGLELSDHDHGRQRPQFIFQNPVAYQLNSSPDYVLPCRPYDKSVKVQLLKGHGTRISFSNSDNSGFDITHESWTSFQPQLGFIIHTNLTEDPWGLYECHSKGDSLVVNLIENVPRIKTVDDSKVDTGWYLRWQIIGSTINCYVKIIHNSLPQGNARRISLVNIRTINPRDSKLKYQCKDRDKCAGVYTKQVGQPGACIDVDTNNSQSCSYLTKYYDSGLLVCSCENQEIQLEYFKGLDEQFYPYDTMQNKPEVVLHLKILLEDVDQKNSQHSVMYIDKEISFECTSVYYGLSLPLLWYTQENDGEFQLYESDTYFYQPLNEQLENVKSTEKFMMTENLTAIMCAVRVWNSTAFINTTFNIPKEKLKETRPTFKKPIEEWTFYIGDQARYLRCRVEGSPEPTLDWSKDGKKINDENILIAKEKYTSTLTFSVVKEIHGGKYSCTAKNSKDTNTKTFILHVKERPSYAVIIGISVFSLILLSAVLISFGIVYHKRRLQSVLTKSETDDFLFGNEHASLSNYETAYAVSAYNKQFEIDKRDMIISWDSVIGFGQYGVVYKGKVHGEDVAIKTTKKDCDKLYVKALLAEVKMMIHIGEHRNIVSLVGARTKDMRKGEVYLALPIYSEGNLQNYLRKCDKFIPLKIDGTANKFMSEYENMKNMICITTKDLWKWSYQIANGMAHLTGKNVIHGDLATRNILLCGELNAKICDFGLSKKLYDMEIYTKKSKDPLPWRWMAVEALEFMQFSIKSDVWSYGITMWEIFSMGAIPYSGVIWTPEFMEQMRKGLRLSKPRHACEHIYELMTSCWHENVEERESFSNLSDILYKTIVEMPADPFSDVSYL